MTFALAVLLSLKENYAEALRRNDVKAIVVTGTCHFIHLGIIYSTVKVMADFCAFCEGFTILFSDIFFSKL
jgi:hypothetical protein